MKKRTNLNLENKSGITELKQLKESEERFRNTFEQAAVGIAHVGPDAKFIRINQKFCDIVGYSRQEMLKLTFLDITHQDDLGPDLDNVQGLLDNDIDTYSMEKRYIRKNKSIVWINLSVSLIRNDTESPEYFIAVVKDITDRKQQEEELKKRVEFQELVSKISTKFIDLPAEKIDQAINEQFEEIGKFFKVDRVTIGELSEKGEVLEATNMWFSDQLNVEKIATDMRGATYPNLVNHIKDQEYWSFSNPDDFSHWHPERETIEKTDIKSGLVINISFDQSILEIFVIDVMHANRVWTKNTIEDIKLLGNIFSNALNRKKAQQALEREAEFKQLVSRISTKFTGISGEEFEQAIQDKLEEIGRYFGVDTVRLYQLSLHGEVLKFRLMWRSEDLAPPEEIPEIHKMKYPNLAAHYSEGKSVLFSKFDDSPKWPEMRKILKFFGTKAGVGVPLEADKSGVDVFAMDKVLSEHTWPRDIIKQSIAIGEVLLSAVRRREAEVKLRNSYDEINRLKNRLEQENIYLQEETKIHRNFDKIIGQSSSLNFVLHRVEQVAPTDATVLIQGETGTGKELFAHALHSLSLRKHKSLIKVGCASLSTTLIESEFFGHEKGAFTGADRQRIGRFELADKGSIFLDEIGELSIELQAKLLRVLQEGEIERLGSSKTIKVDVRVIAATNRNLEEEVAQGRFREDLYYRLNTFKLSVPPLRDRDDDIPVLVSFFVEKLAKKLGKKIKNIPKSSMRELENYSWPGNIRELQNTIENAIIISDNEILKVEIPGSSFLSQKGKMKLKDIEKDHIIEVLNSTNWRLGGKGGAAELLGMKRTTLHAKMRKYRIERQT
jgi:PAS domain S-box-containing protein